MRRARVIRVAELFVVLRETVVRVALRAGGFCSVELRAIALMVRPVPKTGRVQNIHTVKESKILLILVDILSNFSLFGQEVFVQLKKPRQRGRY